MALDIVDNIIPYIPGEEEKVARETGKILGVLGEGGIVPAAFPVSATCTRAAVSEGHTEAVAVSLGRRASAGRRGRGLPRVRQRARAARPCRRRRERLITVHDDPFRPQPRLDRDADGGMTTSVGRIREDHALENGIKYLLVSHNTKMGAAKGAVLTAEYLATTGYL